MEQVDVVGNQPQLEQVMDEEAAASGPTLQEGAHAATIQSSNEPTDVEANDSASGGGGGGDDNVDVDARKAFRAILNEEPGYLAPVVVIDEVLSAADVQDVHRELDSGSCEAFSQGSQSKHYRNTDRTVLHSPATAEKLWHAVKPYFRDRVGAVVVHEGSTGVGRVFPYGSEGRWVPVGVSPVFRVNKYGPGQHFGPHFDGFNLLGRGGARDGEMPHPCRTFFTLVTYLTDTALEHGGATNFLKEHTPMGPNAEGIHKASEDNIAASVQPVAGSGVIFHHHTKHEGQQLTGGSKMILNCDVLFERVPGTERPLRESEIEAANILRRAQACEEEGDFVGATKLYSAVRKVDEAFAVEHGVG